MVLRMTNADHRPGSSAGTPLCLTQAECVDRREGRTSHATYRISAGVVWGWHTAKPECFSDDLKYDAGRTFPLGHLLALCPQADPCTSLGPRFAICQWWDWTRGSFLALLGSSSVKSTLVKVLHSGLNL